MQENGPENVVCKIAAVYLGFNLLTVIIVLIGFQCSSASIIIVMWAYE